MEAAYACIFNFVYTHAYIQGLITYVALLLTGRIVRLDKSGGGAGISNLVLSGNALDQYD